MGAIITITNIVVKETFMNCPNCQHEIADDVQICPNCGANVAPVAEALPTSGVATASAPSVINMNGTRKIPFIVAFVALCVVAVGYLAYIVSNIALEGDFVASATFIKTILGRIAVSLVRAIIPVSLVIAIVALFKAYKSKGDLFDNLMKVQFATRVLSIFAIFTIIDMFVIFFYLLIGNSVVGDALTYKSNFELLDAVSKFAGYEGLELSKTVFKGLEDGIGALAFAVGFGLVAFAYSIYNAVVLNKVKYYCEALAGFSGGAQYDKDTKSPFVWMLVVLPYYIFGGVLSVMAGVYVNAVIQLGMAILLCSLAFAFRGLHKDLIKTSAD